MTVASNRSVNKVPSFARDFRCPRTQGTAVTIGNFDGVHRGHQAMLEVVGQAARQRGLLPTVLTFSPSPGMYFARRAGKLPPALLQRTRDKLACIWALGIQHVQMARFNEMMSAMKPEEFCASVLKQGLNAKWIIVGDDFRYGHNRTGDVKTLHAWATANGIECYVMPTVKAMEVRFSSTLVRQCLHDGDLTSVAAILGRPYRISGKVVHGQKLGRTLGIPTVNLPIWSPLPLSGIFAVRVYGVDISGVAPVLGAASVGVRPTVTDHGQALLEVYLLDFQGDLYGKRIVVEFVQQVRGEEKFTSLDAMTQQIYADIAAVRQIFSNAGYLKL